jgi:PAS domain-containing protein
VPPSDKADAAWPVIDGLALAPPQHRRRSAARAAVAVLASALAVALTVALAPVVPRASFVVAYAAVTVAAWYGGAWPGLLAGVLCVLGVDYYLIPPIGGFRPTDPGDYVPMAVFVGVAWLTGTLTDSLGHARAAMDRAAGDLRAANQQLREQALELELSNQQLHDQAAELELQTEELQARAAQLERRTGEAEDARRRAEAERAAAHESERRFRATADAAPVLIWTSGLDALCDWFNQPWLAFTGRPRASGRLRPLPGDLPRRVPRARAVRDGVPAPAPRRRVPLAARQRGAALRGGRHVRRLHRHVHRRHRPTPRA